MIATLGDEQLIFLDSINQPMLPIQAARPPARELPFERLRLAGPVKRGARTFLDETVQAGKQLAIMLLPIEVVVPSLFMEDDLHSIRAFSTPLPVSSSSTAFNRRLEFSGLLSR